VFAASGCESNVVIAEVKSEDRLESLPVDYRSFSDATAGTNSAAQPDQLAGVINRLSSRRAFSVS
jgi:hypothetical protein